VVNWQSSAVGVFSRVFQNLTPKSMNSSEPSKLLTNASATPPPTNRTRFVSARSKTQTSFDQQIISKSKSRITMVYLSPLASKASLSPQRQAWFTKSTFSLKQRKSTFKRWPMSNWFSLPSTTSVTKVKWRLSCQPTYLLITAILRAHQVVLRAMWIVNVETTGTSLWRTPSVMILTLVISNFLLYSEVCSCQILRDLFWVSLLKPMIRLTGSTT